MSDTNLSAAIVKAKQAMARHESQNAGDPFRFELTEHRYVALRDLIDALSTPPADDVREALYRAMYTSEPTQGRVASDLFVNRILSDPSIEVRPRGTVTDTDALAKAWDEGVRTAGAYGHEDTWTHDMTPYTQNPYRGEARS